MPSAFQARDALGRRGAGPEPDPHRSHRRSVIWLPDPGPDTRAHERCRRRRAGHPGAARGSGAAARGRGRRPRLQRGRDARARACAGCTPTSSTSFPFSFRITIADNGSTDGTWEAALALAGRAARGAGGAARGQGPRPRARRGLVGERGPACSPTWTSTSRPTSRRCCRSWRRCSRATATSRSAAGSTRGARVVRGSKRELISRCYNALLHVVLRRRASPTPSAGSRRSAPTARASCCRSSRDRSWFFDTELLVLAERAGLRIHEVPVDWVDDPDSRVDIVRDRARRPARGRAARPRPPPARAGAPASCRASAARSRASPAIGVALDGSPTASSTWCCAGCSPRRRPTRSRCSRRRSPTPPPTGA